MKGFAISTGPGVCAYDFDHRWKAETKILRLQGAGWSKAKDYCWPCGERLHGASDETPEFSPWATTAPQVRPLSGLAEGFDVKVAAAGKDE